MSGISSEMLFLSVNKNFSCRITFEHLCCLPAFFTLLLQYIFQVFNSKTAELLSHHQVEIKQEFPKEGWVEQDPKEILLSVYECIEKTCEKLGQLNIDISNIKAIGVSNQRETTVVWDKLTGEPLYNAVGKLLCVDVKCKAFFYLQMWSC